MTNPHYTSLSQYRDVESLNYFQILREQGKTEAEALEILAARSRDNSRTPMQWSDEENAGFTTGTPWITPSANYSHINAALEVQDNNSVLAFYRELIRLRKAEPLIQDGRIEFLLRDNANVLSYRRYDSTGEIRVICNLTDHTLPVPEMPGQRLLGNYPDDPAEALRPYEVYVTKSALEAEP